VKVAIVIPARYNSSRLPGKPLAVVAGQSLIERVWRIARAVDRIDAVYVATDDGRILDHAVGFGAQCLMTAADCRTGTDRVRDALRQMPDPPDAVINLQGDAVLTPPWVVQALADAFRDQPAIGMVTAAVRLTWRQVAEVRAVKAQSPASGTLVTMDASGRALYFSKAMIPFVRQAAAAGQHEDEAALSPLHRHVGIYGYARDTLEALSALPQTPLEQAEQLEQLRALEHGIPIQVVVVDYRGRTHGSVDTVEDIGYAEAVLAREGELV
jgi:3-deoxy-manno-octulosonate cytidylyltransferase (CMP-KDO synthetase)